MKILSTVFLLAIFSLQVLANDKQKKQHEQIINRLIQIKIDKAELASELILLDADISKTITKNQKRKIKDEIRRSILGRYIDKKIMQLKSECETENIQDLIKQIKPIGSLGCNLETSGAQALCTPTPSSPEEDRE